MKIVHLAASYYPRGGGVEHHLEQINRLLVAAGHQVEVLTLAHSDDLPSSEVFQGVRVRRLSIKPAEVLPKWGHLRPLIAKTKEKLWLWRSVWQEINLLRSAHIVQVHDVFWWLLPYWWLLPGKVFITFHGYEKETGPTAGQRRWHQLADQLTDGSLTIGAFHEAWYGVVAEQISYGGLDVSDDKTGGANRQSLARSRSKSIDATGQRTLMALGRLEVGTGLPELVHALALSSDRVREGWQVDIYGDGPLKEHLQNYINKEKLPINLHGFKPEAREQLDQADLVMASQYLAILESLRAGRAPLSYAGSEFKLAYLTMTPFAKWLTIAHSSREIADILESLTSAPLPKLPDEARGWALSQSWEKVVNQYYLLWQSSPTYER